MDTMYIKCSKSNVQLLSSMFYTTNWLVAYTPWLNFKYQRIFFVTNICILKLFFFWVFYLVFTGDEMHFSDLYFVTYTWKESRMKQESRDEHSVTPSHWVY